MPGREPAHLAVVAIVRKKDLGPNSQNASSGQGCQGFEAHFRRLLQTATGAAKETVHNPNSAVVRDISVHHLIIGHTGGCQCYALKCWVRSQHWHTNVTENAVRQARFQKIGH